MRRRSFVRGRTSLEEAVFVRDNGMPATKPTGILFPECAAAIDNVRYGIGWFMIQSAVGPPGFGRVSKADQLKVMHQRLYSCNCGENASMGISPVFNLDAKCTWRIFGFCRGAAAALVRPPSSTGRKLGTAGEHTWAAGPDYWNHLMGELDAASGEAVLFHMMGSRADISHIKARMQAGVSWKAAPGRKHWDYGDCVSSTLNQFIRRNKPAACFGSGDGARFLTISGNRKPVLVSGLHASAVGLLHT